MTTPPEQLHEAVRNYQTPEEAVNLLEQHPPLLIAGASSVGKDAVASRVIEQSDYQRVITHTTRKPRQYEADKENYWFVSTSDFEKMLSNHELIEVQLVHGDTVYGTSIAAYKKVIENGKQPLLIVDIYGVLKLLHCSPNSRAVFLLPPSFEEWMSRFEKRGSLTAVDKKRRLRTARAEMELALKTPQIQLLANDDLASTAKKVLAGQITPESQTQNRDLVHRLIEHTRAY